MTASTILPFPARPVDRHTETVATSPYLNQPLRTEAEVVSLRERRMAVEPRTDKPCDSGDAA